MRRGSHQDDVALWVRGELRHELIALMPPTAIIVAVRAGVRLVYDHHLRTCTQELIAASVGLDEIGRDNDMRVQIKDGLIEAAVAFKARDGARQHDFRLDVELVTQFVLPLWSKLR